MTQTTTMPILNCIGQISNNMHAARTLEEAQASLQKPQHEITTFAFLTTTQANNRKSFILSIYFNDSSCSPVVAFLVNMAKLSQKSKCMFSNKVFPGVKLVITKAHYGMREQETTYVRNYLATFVRDCGSHTRIKRYR